MGMLFNSEATLDMLATVNDEFSKGKKHNNWKPRRPDFAGPKNLRELVDDYKFYPKKGGNKAKIRWQYWLENVLHAKLSDELPYPTGPSAPFAYPPKVGKSTVGNELKKLLGMAFEDDLCAEVVMVIQPDTKVYLTRAQRIPLLDPSGEYSLVLTLSTEEIDPKIGASPAHAKKD